MLWAMLLPLALVFAGGLGWFCFQQSRRRFRATEVTLVEPQEIPEEVVERLKPFAEGLIESGFEFRCARQEVKPEGQEAWQVVLSTAEGRVWSVIEEVGKKHRVTLESFGADGAVALTRSGFREGGMKAYEQLLQHRVFGSAMEQAEAHAELLQKEDVPLAPLSMDDFFSAHARVTNRYVQLMHEAGWMEACEDGALKLSWKALFQALGLDIKKTGLELLALRQKGSWLNPPKPEEVKEEVEEEVRDESGGEESVEEEVETVPVLAEEDEDLKKAVEEVIAATTDAAENPKPRAALADESSEEEEVDSESEPEPEPEMVIPQEEGLARDWALYQLQQRKASWAYWLQAYGTNAVFFLGLLGLALWMAVQGVWSWQMVGFGVAAWFVHEVGHAVAMILARRWDESVFFPALPRPIAAGKKRLTGGWKELLVILAGPVPGMAAGWAMLIDGYRNSGGSDTMLDFALVLVLVNGVTLLPFRMFDGGRLFDLLVFRSMPKLRFPVYLLAALVLFLSVPFGGGVLAAVAGALFLAEMSLGPRQSKLLPWIQANISKEPKDDVDVATTLRVIREKGFERLLKPKGWAAGVDELVATARSRSAGMSGLLASAFLMLLGLGLPLLLPAVEVGRRSGDWFAMQKKAEGMVQSYRGERNSKELGDDTRWDLDFLQNSTKAFKEEPARAFEEQAVLETVRKVQWNLATDWVAESPEERQEVATLAVKAMHDQALLFSANGQDLEAFRDLSVALRIILGCEPAHSLTAWVEWTDLENEFLKSLEKVSARHTLKASQAKWFMMALEKAPQPTGKKMAALWLSEGQGMQAFLEGLKSEATKGFQPQLAGASPARAFLGGIKSAGGLVPLEQMGTRFDLARKWAEEDIVTEVPDDIGLAENARIDLEKLLARVQANRSFRQLALSALKVKQGGIQGASEALAKLEGEFGLRARVETDKGKQALRAVPANEREGQVVEWLIKDAGY